MDYKSITTYGTATKYRLTANKMRWLWRALWIAIPIPVISGAIGIATAPLLFKKDLFYIRRYEQ